MRSLIETFAIASAADWSQKLQLSKAEEDVVHFVVGQVGRMAKFLRLPLLIGLHLVNIHFIFLGQLPFALKSRVGRKEALTRLRDHRFKAFRDMIRLVDSLVLLTLAELPHADK